MAEDCAHKPVITLPPFLPGLANNCRYIDVGETAVWAECHYWSCKLCGAFLGRIDQENCPVWRDSQKVPQGSK